jgi:hypothetical protein
MFPLFKVSSEIVTSILCCWVDTRSLGRLDSAVCQHAWRTELLTLLKSEFFVAHGIADPGEQKVLYFQWLTLREVRLSNWNLGYHLPTTLIADLARKTGGLLVHSLHIHQMGEVRAAVTLMATSLTCRHVTNIKITECDHWTGMTVLSGEAQISLCELELSSCQTKHAIDFTRNHFPNIKKLVFVEVTGGEGLAKSMASLFSSAPNLADLRLSYMDIGTTALQGLRNHADKLKTLLLHDCRFESKSELTSLAEKCVNLKCLHVLGDTELTDTEVVAFAAHCPQLEAVQFQWGVRAGAVHGVALHCGGHLRYLVLDGILFENGAGLRAIAEHCCHLRELAITACTGPGVTADCLVLLVSSLPYLRELIIADCSSVTDAVLIAIATHLPELTFLRLVHSRGFTAAGAAALLHSLCQLRHFSIEGFNRVFTKEVLNEWMNRVPGLTVGGVVRDTTSYFQEFVWWQ